jgi:hypothetical protein
MGKSVVSTSSEKVFMNLNKIKKLWAEYGVRMVIRKCTYLAAKQLAPPSDKRIVRKRDIIFNSLGKEALDRDVESFFSIGVLRPLNQIKADIRQVPEQVAQGLMEQAKRILENEFMIYDSFKVKFGPDQFTWMSDPLSGFQWPLDLGPTYVMSKKLEGTDIKTIWEIARFQFLAPVAMAYALTDEKQYVHFAIDKVNSWIDENPFPHGPHWAVAMEVAIRLVNWCFYLPLLDVFDLADFSLSKKLTKSILEHLIFIRENLEISPGHANNHYLSNLSALLLGRLIFPSLTWAVKSSEFAEKELEREIQRQFKPSGINFEGSLPYHRLSSEICLTGAALILKSGREVPSEIVNRLRKAASFTQYYTEASDESPVIGDNDSGVFIKFFPGQQLNEHHYLNCLFDAILEGKSEPRDFQDFFCSVHLTDTYLPKVYSNTIRSYNSNNELQVKNFDGLVIARHRSEALFFNTLDAFSGHTHNDKLSIYPVINGKALFVDRGSFSYTGFTNKRHEDRTTFSHNGPLINGWEQNRIWKDDQFFMGAEAKCDATIDASEHMVRVTGWHAGYGRYRKHLKTFRQITWDIRERTMLVTDWLDGTAANEDFQFTWYFLINPAWIAVVQRGCLILNSESQTVRFEDSSGIGFALSKGLYSPNYQEVCTCQVLTASCKAPLGKRIDFLLYY